MGNIFVKKSGISDNISVLFFFCHCAVKICHQKEYLLFLICDKMQCTIDQKTKEKSIVLSLKGIVPLCS
jgi:hypothetical protein